MNKLTKIWFYSLAMMGVLLMLSSSCKKKDNTPTPLTLTDIDGNVYHTVTIGNQVWMFENLKTTRYNDGTAITLITDSIAWVNVIYSSISGYCWYNNDDAAYKNTYGAIYNWYTVNTGKLAPIGWHIPTDAEWTILTTYLGGESVAGNKMKEAGTSHWLPLNLGADNSSGFSALPGGCRFYDASFNNIGLGGSWWSVTESDSGSAWERDLDGGSAIASRGDYGKTLGCSIRCVKN